MWHFFIPGRPTPLARPRFSKTGRVYDCQKYKKQEDTFYIRRAMHNKAQPQGPLLLQAVFKFDPRHRELDPDSIYYQSQNPDLDNCIKYICDICQPIVFANDNCIAEIRARKVYSHDEGTEFIISELPEKVGE